MSERTYIAIDLKSFYASVECRERGLDPLTTNLVVADESRTEKTICLAVSPSLKSYGIPGRARLFEVIQQVGRVNEGRRAKAPGRELKGSSFFDPELKREKALALDYIIAPPRMALYMEYSTRIYGIYRSFVEKEHIHPYSVDEVFIDATEELKASGMTAREFAMMMIREVLRQTGITATAGIGTNLYLCKIAMDIVAKHIPADADGVRIAELDVMSYRRQLWDHEPLTDFWRVGQGTVKRLEKLGVRTMGGIARMSLTNEDALYRAFGVNAELLIDHAWGLESCLMEDIKAYRPRDNSLSVGQVLSCPYPFEKGRIIAREMTEGLSLDMVEKRLVTGKMTLTVGYDVPDRAAMAQYKGEKTRDRYGRELPKEAHGTVNLDGLTNSTREMAQAIVSLYDRIVDKTLMARRMYVVAEKIVSEDDVREDEPEQLDFFTDYEALERERSEKKARREKEKRAQRMVLELHKKFGRNSLVKGMDLQEGATAMERNRQIGGHKA